MSNRYEVRQVPQNWQVWDTTKNKSVSESYASEEDAEIFCEEINRYQDAGQNPHRWLQQAKWLQLSADLHRKRYTQIVTGKEKVPYPYDHVMSAFYAYLMLIGFALECLIKGAHIAQKPNLTLETRFQLWNQCQGGHGLTKLIKLLDLPGAITDEEESLLQRAQEFSVWAGRYPVKKSFQPRDVSHSLNSNDFKIVRRLFKNLGAIILSVDGADRVSGIRQSTSRRVSKND